MGRAGWEVSDELWAVIELLLPSRERRFRLAMARASPAGGGCRSGRRWACGRVCTPSCFSDCARLIASTGRGVRGCQSCAGQKGGSATGPSPVDRGRLGAKHHLVVDAAGLPLAYATTPGNRNDVTQLMPLLDRIGPVGGRRGRPRHRPDVVYADRGFDHDKYRRQLRARGIRHRIARRNTTNGSGSAASAGSLNAASPGCTPSNASPSATNAAPICTKPSSPSAAP